jgi:hypothetical protein
VKLFGLRQWETLCLDRRNLQNWNSKISVLGFFIASKTFLSTIPFALKRLLIDCEVLDAWLYLSKFTILFW